LTINPHWSDDMTRVTFLGTAAVLPGAGEDTACFLINGSILFDTAWYAALKMQSVGYSPLDVEWLIFTHCHHDHYMGLPALLFFRGMSRGWGRVRPPLKIIGPPSDLETVVRLSRDFLQTDRFPDVWPEPELFPLPPGESFETDAFRLETRRSLHGVEGSCGRFTDRTTGRVVAFSGDTGPNPSMVELAWRADLLIHEASLAPETPDERAVVHSRATDAARVAAEAEVARLRLVHLGPDHRQRSLEAARQIYPAAQLAAEGETVNLG
jgi:ribonuclease Z